MLSVDKGTIYRRNNGTLTIEYELAQAMKVTFRHSIYRLAKLSKSFGLFAIDQCVGEKGIPSEPIR